MDGEAWVIFAAGDWCEAPLINRFVTAATNILACDGALDRCREWGVHPTHVIGDMDSATQEALEAFTAQGGQLIQRMDQNQHDLSKALSYANENGATTCIVFGATGGDEQHTWANLLSCAVTAMDIICVSSDLTYRFFRPGTSYSIECQPGSAFSLFALPEAKKIVLSGAKYPLKHSTMAMGSQGLHNECVERTLQLSFEEGRLMMLHPHASVSVEDVNGA